MHSLLKRQLKKIGYSGGGLSEEQTRHLISVVDQGYQDCDDDRALLENTLLISSKEMQGLYKQLKETSESELAKSEAKYRHLIENLQYHYFFYIRNSENRFTYLSDSIVNILGYDKDEFLTHYTKYLSDESFNLNVQDYSHNSLNSANKLPHIISMNHKDGSMHYLEITEFPVFDSKGNVELVEGMARDVTLQHEIQEKMSYMVKHDTLTGISNRLYLDEQIQDLIAYSKRHQNKFAMLFLDLDHFKHINDTLGHHVGDKLLQEVSKRIHSNIREEDIFARIGGDEFVIVLTDIHEIDIVVSIHKIMDLMRQSWYVENVELNVATSVGVALYPQDGTTVIELMKNADIAMYQAKELGRDNFTFFTPSLNERVHEEMSLEQDMADALIKKQFELYFQPIVKLDTNKVMGAEALVRWNHSKKGIIDPDKFIKLAESTGFIIKLGAWVIEEGCRAIARFNTLNVEKFKLSVNVSARQFQHSDLSNIIKNAIKNAGIESNQFCIEITENVMLNNHEKIMKKINDIKSLGVDIAIDDFGTGYSSLSYLHHLNINTIKIDKSFVDQITTNSDRTILIDTVIAIGKSLDKNVIAEGVENEYQRTYLKEQGCELYQGYLFSKPLNESDYCTMLTSI